MNAYLDSFDNKVINKAAQKFNRFSSNGVEYNKQDI